MEGKCVCTALRGRGGGGLLAYRSICVAARCSVGDILCIVYPRGPPSLLFALCPCCAVPLGCGLQVLYPDVPEKIPPTNALPNRERSCANGESCEAVRIMNSPNCGWPGLERCKGLVPTAIQQVRWCVSCVCHSWGRGGGVL
jgi:hypothetical protein